MPVPDPLPAPGPVVTPDPLGGGQSAGMPGATTVVTTVVTNANA